MIPDLDKCTNLDKKNAYIYLDLKDIATPESVDIKGYLSVKSHPDFYLDGRLKKLRHSNKLSA